MMGGVRLSDKKRIVDFISKGTGDSFFSVLHGGSPISYRLENNQATLETLRQ